jgi:nucleoid-associated protein YgaU
MFKHQVHLDKLNMEGGKLYLKGIAPSEDAKNKVWDEIKRIDPDYEDDLICDIIVEHDDAPHSPPVATFTRTHIVQPGDTLSSISGTYYGDPNQYMKIFDANKDQLSDPDEIEPGQRLLIP